ncbi:RICIN domain-containing protein [Streptomyces sp. NPDC000229]|uniref:RICIN domain-containing protein n=1 Tax=Streptomyces sp. NPDC000229 TaxID=3154247 RepID=UPI00332BFB5B
MRKATKGLVLAGAATAMLAGTVAPATAATAGAAKATSPYANVRLEKVWGKIGMCLSMDGSTKNNAVLKLRGCSKNDASQRWTLSGSKGVYTIKNRKSGKCLGVSSTKSGTQVTQRSCNAKSSTQQWTLGGSKIISKWAGKVITANNDASGTKIVISQYDKSTAGRKKQEWGLS